MWFGKDHGASHMVQNQIMHKIPSEGMQKFKKLKFSRKLPPTLIPFIILNKNQHAHGKEMTIMMHGMQNK